MSSRELVLVLVTLVAAVAAAPAFSVEHRPASEGQGTFPVVATTMRAEMAARALDDELDFEHNEEPVDTAVDWSTVQDVVTDPDFPLFPTTEQWVLRHNAASATSAGIAAAVLGAPEILEFPEIEPMPGCTAADVECDRDFRTTPAQAQGGVPFTSDGQTTERLPGKEQLSQYTDKVRGFGTGEIVFLSHEKDKHWSSVSLAQHFMPGDLPENEWDSVAWDPQTNVVMMHANNKGWLSNNLVFGVMFVTGSRTYPGYPPSEDEGHFISFLNFRTYRATFDAGSLAKDLVKCTAKLLQVEHGWDQAPATAVHIFVKCSKTRDRTLWFNDHFHLRLTVSIYAKERRVVLTEGIKGQGVGVETRTSEGTTVVIGSGILVSGAGAYVYQRKRKAEQAKAGRRRGKRSASSKSGERTRGSKGSRASRGSRRSAHSTRPARKLDHASAGSRASRRSNRSTNAATSASVDVV